MADVTPPIADASNADQLHAWDGDEGAFWTANADRFDRAIAAYQGEFLAAADIAETDHVLDIGCGTGQTTRDAARAASSGSALGVDLSSQMISLARRLAAGAGIRNARFEQTDAQVHPFEQAAFDVAISRTGAMFFGDAVAAFTNIGRALRTDGRLTLLTWQAMPRNEWIGAFSSAMAAGRDLPIPPPDAGPFSLSDPDRVHRVLSAAGFSDVTLDGVNAPMQFGESIDDAYQLVSQFFGWMLNDLDDSSRSRALDALRATITAHHEAGHGVCYDSATWIVRARHP
jgi:SAM-dependent methyltransferase